MRISNDRLAIMASSRQEHECHPAQKLIDSASPYDEYKPYPVQPKIDPSDPLYRHFEKEHEFRKSTSSTPAVEKEDPSTFDARKATQHGHFDRVKELIDNGQDANELDSDGVSLLHWAAINNKKDIAKLLIDHGAVVEKYGGILNSTALQWATRQGHLSMVVFLVSNGADPTAVDAEGYQCLHLASMFSHSSIVAYLIAKGYDVDTPDKNGMTPLMWACYRSSSTDPTRLLLNLGADVNKKDAINGHTPLHWALLVGNSASISQLLKHPVNLNTLNTAGQTPLDLAVTKKNRWLIDRIKKARLERGYDSKGYFQSRTVHSKAFREKYMIAYPFFALWAVGWVFEVDYWWAHWWSRLLLLALLFLTFQYSRRWFFDDRLGNTIPFGLYMATKVWMYFTWFFYAVPLIHSMVVHCLFFINSALLIYHFYRSVTNDPGYLSPTRNQQIETILMLAEQEKISIEQFCSTCLIRKPLRSKHCSFCDKCVAKFDHHCPWIYNCVGTGNMKHFIWYLTYLVGMILWCMYGCITFWLYGCSYTGSGFLSYPYEALISSPWVAWIFLNSCLHLAFVGVLLGNILYQAVYLGLTTNEKINLYRYKYLKKDGTFHNPYHRGIIKNCVDEVQCSCMGLFKPTSIDWRTVYRQPGDDYTV